MNFCENSSILEVLLMIKYIMKIIFVAAPIALIVTAMVDFTKTISNTEDKNNVVSKFVKKSIAAVCIFLVPTIITIFLNLLGNSENALSTCASNINRETIKKLRLIEEEKRKEATIKPSNNESNPSISSSTVTVATWNIKHGSDKSNLTAGSFSRYIVDNRINLIGIQEAKKNGDNLINEIARNAEINNVFYSATPAGMAIISGYELISKTKYDLVSCGEARSLQKIVVKINNKNISFYNVHLSYESNCPAKQIKDVIQKISSDSNPLILLGDFNVGRSCSIIENELPSNYKLVAYDTLSSGVKCTDSIIISNNITIESKSTIETKNKVTDHNLVMAKLKIQ